MADAAQKVDESQPESAPRTVADEEGVVLPPEEEEELEQAIAEAHEDLRAGRCVPVDVIRAKLRAV